MTNLSRCDSAPSKASADSQPTRFIPVPDWHNYYDWPPEGGLRHLIFHAKTNGFESAFKRVGRRVLIDEAKFWHIVADGE